MIIWLTSMNRKVHQRAINKLIRGINTHIKNDDLWLGRFYIKQIKSSWKVYEDKSGAELWVYLRFIDRKTGTTWDDIGTVNSYRFGNKLYWKMNDFIVKVCDVWRNEDPVNNRINFRDIKDSQKMR